MSRDFTPVTDPFPDKRLPRGLGCLLVGFGAFALFGLFTIFGMGVGRPYTYHLRISQVQAFEDSEGVTLFVEVERQTRYPGYLQEGGPHKAVQLRRLRVAPDGLARDDRLGFAGRATFNTNIAPIVRLPEGFALIVQPSRGRPSCEINRIRADQIVSGGLVGSDQVAQAAGLGDGRARGIFDFANLDAISARNGATRINGVSHVFGGLGRPIASSRHGLDFRVVEEGSTEAIVVEPRGGGAASARAILTVNTTRWRAYPTRGD